MDNLRGTGRTYRRLEHCVDGMLNGNKIMFVLAEEREFKRSVRMVLTILEKLGIRANVDKDRVSIAEKGFIQFGGFSNTLKDMKNGRFNEMTLGFTTDHFVDERGVISSRDYEAFDIYARVLNRKPNKNWVRELLSENKTGIQEVYKQSEELRRNWLYGDWDIPENSYIKPDNKKAPN